MSSVRSKPGRPTKYSFAARRPGAGAYRKIRPSPTAPYIQLKSLPPHLCRLKIAPLNFLSARNAIGNLSEMKCCINNFSRYEKSEINNIWQSEDHCVCRMMLMESEPNLLVSYVAYAPCYIRRQTTTMP